MNLIYLLLFVSIELFGVSYLLSKCDIMSPSVIMSAMFIISTIFAILNIDNWGIDFGFDTVFILTIGMITFIVAEFFMHLWVEKIIPRTNRVDRLDLKPIRVQNSVLIVIILIDVFVLVWFYLEIKRIVSDYGYAANGSAVFGSYYNIITKLAKRSDAKTRMTGTVLNQLIKFLLATGYISLYVITYNFFFSKKKTKQIILYAIIVLLSFSVYLMQGQRGNILQMLAGVIIEWSILWHQKNGWSRNITGRMIAIGIFTIAVGIPLFYGSLQLMGRQTNKDILEYAGFYAGGSIQLFDLYVKDPTAKPVIFGEESLIGLHRLLNKFGANIDVRNVNLEFRELNSYTRGNVYTFFRRPLHDFGFAGMLVFTILVSFLFAWIYYGKIKYRKNKNVDLWILIYGYMFYWIITTSILQYSQSILSLTAAIQIALICIGYKILTSTRFLWRGKKLP